MALSFISAAEYHFFLKLIFDFLAALRIVQFPLETLVSWAVMKQLKYFYYNLLTILFIQRQSSQIDSVFFQKMLHKIYKLLFMMVLISNLIIGCQNQHFNTNKKLNDESDQNVDKKLGSSDQFIIKAQQPDYIQVQPIEYLQNILTLDTLIYFIYCNYTIPYEQLESRTMYLINSRENNNVKDIQLCNEEIINKQSGQDDKQQKNCCLFCGKQFKNSTYLAMHYLIAHPTLVISNRKRQKKLNQYQIPAKKSMENIIFRIISNPIVEKLTDIELNLLFSSSNPQTQIYQYCQFLFSNFFNSTSVTSEKWLQRYRQFIRNGKSSQLCNMIAYRMYQIGIWTKIGKYVGLVVVVFSLLWWIMLRRQNNIQKQRMWKKKKSKFQRY